MQRWLLAGLMLGLHLLTEAAPLRFTYGPETSQFAELTRPAGPGPFPVVVLLHGGCRRSRDDDFQPMQRLAHSLGAQGVAVWNVDYRQVQEPGGGYPGTWLDLQAAMAQLATVGPDYQLDRTHLLALGVGQGAPLAIWLGARGRLLGGSPLARWPGTVVHEVMAVNGPVALADRQRHLLVSCPGGPRTLPVDNPARSLSDIDPAALLPSGTHVMLLGSRGDRRWSASAADAFTRQAQQAGDRAEVVVVPGRGTLDLTRPGPASWRLLWPRIQRALAVPAAVTPAPRVPAPATRAAGH